MLGKMGELRWDDVRVFLAVHRHGTMAGAARALKVDQTTVGRRLAALEEALDARLFDRKPDGLALTPAGEGILAAAERCEESVLALERRASGEDTRVEGTVRIATSESFGAYFVGPRIARLRARVPSVAIEITTAQSFVALSRREADLAIRLRPKGSPPAQENVVCKKLVDLPWALFASRAYVAERGTPADPDDLTGHDVIDMDDDVQHMPGGPWLRAAAARANVVARATSIMTFLAAAAGGAGLALVPSFMGFQAGLVQIGPPRAWAEGWLLVHPDLARVARVRAVMEALSELVRADHALFTRTDPGG